MSCPGPERVLDYLGRRLAVTERDAFEAHLDACVDCRELMVELAHTTLLEDIAEPDPRREPRAESTAPLLDVGGARYEIGEMLGRGGMGEVRLARDVQIQRDVAMKLMSGSPDNAPMLARFTREARLQGSLEHPAIVPIYDLGIDKDGRPFFVMKRLAGTTLEELLSRDQTDRSRRQLLGKLVDVCLAIEFAHTRGVVHRDIKPANIMLGDFGEAYVLDWGIAKVVEVSSDLSQDIEPIVVDDVKTRAGGLVGTPGYMAPEQARGEPVDTRADVYALGCVFAKILVGGDAPELDDLCSRARSESPDARPTARELAQGIQAYLDGDRDLAKRRELAELHTRKAEDAMTDDDRSVAMREAGRAIALDPDSAAAQAVLGSLLLDAPKNIPADAMKASDATRAKTRRMVLYWISLVYFGLALFSPLFLLFPRHDTLGIVVLCLLDIAMAVTCGLLGRRDLPLRTRWYFVTIGLNTAILMAGMFLFGPLLVMPMFVIGSLAAWLSVPTGYRAWVSIAFHAVAVAVPVAMELLGWLPSTYRTDGRNLILTPPFIDLSSTPTAVMLVFTFVGQASSVAFVMIAMRRIQDAMQDRVHSHTWHLEQLLPKRTASSRATPRMPDR